MGCTSSTARRSAPRLDKVGEATPSSPSSSSSHSELPVILESSTLSTGYREMSSQTTASRSVQPQTPQRRLHHRRRREPHLDHHLSDRLDVLTRYLQRASKFDKQEALYIQTQQAIDDLLDDIHSFFIVYEAEKRPLWRLAQTGRVVQQVESFHRTLDAITARCGLAVVGPSGSGPSLPRWQSRWRRMRAERLVFFKSYLDEQEVVAISNSRVREYSDQLELLTLLKYDAQKFATLLTADELELLERSFAFVASCCGNSVDTEMDMMLLPEWFVAPYERTKQKVKWQRVAVTVQKAPRGMSSRELLGLASIWSRLQHPHVMKMLGACHVSRNRFFVVAEGTPLTRCLGDQGFPIWRALFEAALALQFLHDRRVGLDSLSCSDLVLFRCGDRDVVMVAGFNFRQIRLTSESSAVFDRKNYIDGEQDDPLLEDDESDTDYDDVDVVHQVKTFPAYSFEKKMHWQAPELSGSSLGPTEASDIFVLGMCAIEAFGGNIEDNNATRPPALTDPLKWTLVEQMCSCDPKNRPLLADVLASFQVFAADEEKASADFSSTKRRKKAAHPSLRKTEQRATPTSVECALCEIQAWCDASPERLVLNYQLYERMNDVVARLEVMDTNRTTSQFFSLASLIFRFRDLLQRHVNENPLLRLAATRHAIKMIKELHEELDILMDRFSIDRSGASIHSWSSKQTSFCEQYWKRFRLSLTKDARRLTSNLSGELEISLFRALLAYEVKKHNASYSPRELEIFQTTLEKLENPNQHYKPRATMLTPLPHWFVPHYEVAFNELDVLNRGVFGSVYAGKWMGVDVVVKEIFTIDKPGGASRRGAISYAKESIEDSHQQFLNDVTSWSTLDHAHVLRLLGACHVDSHQFILCEYADHGSIDNYLFSVPAENRGICARRMLHQAALGLLYLHERNIVHADLRCCNILVDTHGTVKLTDFVPSSLYKKRLPNESAVNSDNAIRGVCHWLAPECLGGVAPTFASNVYSLAMCAIEVLSGELPWGCEMSGAAIRAKVSQGLLPPRPANCFSDCEWNLIQRMCCYYPEERIAMSDVVKLLAI
ncbi:unnamed protein product [Phytophthora fragariaefolia]|uniref:Unnamed protein product n=1 Tax=Phytophthora fragariaefolia TaxID=1490495 RepID=A0A9W6Y488_9STRA|nr:unnamed protein product [Phytophthora fragariaefolia]